MSVRKFIRNSLRVEGERMGVKPSLYVARNFDAYQVDKYGETRRRINQAKGTHKRKTWRLRIASVI